MRLNVHTVGTGPKLVLFHGGMGSWNHWTRNFAALGAHYTVHAVDLPGYGGSPTVSKSIERARYIDLVLEGLQPIVGAERFALAGFSFGGVVAAMTAARLGRQVRALSLMGVGGFGPTAKLPMRPIPPESAGEAARRAVFRFNLGVLMLADVANIGEEAVDFQAENFRRTRFDGRGFSLSHSVAQSLPSIPARVQLIYGDRDALALGDIERRIDFVRRIRPEASIVLLTGMGHWVQYEAAEAVNAALLEFLAAGDD